MNSAQLSALADDLVTAGAPGAAVIVVDERDIQQAASGLADLGAARPMQPHLRFRAGSVTKSFVATLVLALAAEHRVALSDTVEEWLPGILPYGREVTVRHLLNHTSGIANNSAMLWDVWYGSPEGRFQSWTPQQLVSVVADRPAEAAPGSKWSYSNVGYILLGLIIEVATDAKLSGELSRVIFGPLSLHGTSFPDDITGIPGPASHGYSLPLSPQLEIMEGPLVDFTAQHPSLTWAAGAMLSTLPDLCRFFRVLLGGGLLPSEHLGEMLTTVEVPPESLPLPLYQRYGLGIVEIETPQGPLVASPGGIPGFLNIIMSTQDGRRQAGMMINMGDQAPSSVIKSFMNGIRELGSSVMS